MKRTKRFISTILTNLVLCFCLLFAGCAGKVEGTYKFKSMKYEGSGMSINLEVGEEFMGMITLTEDFVKLTLEEDGSAVIVMNAGDETDTMSGTWIKNEDGKLEITFEGDTQVCECNGKTLTIEMEGMKLTLEK